VLAGQLALVVSVCAVCGAAVRLVALLIDRGEGPSKLGWVERVVAAAPIAAGFAVLWTLALGFAGLGGSAPALAIGPVGAWALARYMLPPPREAIASALADAWESAGVKNRAAALAAIGVAVAAAIEIAVEPAFGVDVLTYHLPDVIGWIHTGHTAAVQRLSYEVPYGYYPITNEVLLTWVLGISRSFAPLALFSPAIAGLILLGLWSALRRLGTAPATTCAALLAVATMPMVMLGINVGAAGTDLAAVAWLACAAALSARSSERPALLGPALLAAGLGVGTKTTVAPLAIVALAAGAWRARDQLKRARISIAIGAVAGVLGGVSWYVRTALDHGWPLWPFSSGPGGDPVPAPLTLMKASFLSDSSSFISSYHRYYVHGMAGGLALIAGTVAIPILVRTRRALAFSALGVLAVLDWALAPYTGISSNALLAPLGLTTIRYMLAALCACAVAVAVAARDGSLVVRRAATGLLLAAAVWSVIADLAWGYPTVPRMAYLFAGAAVGALAGAGAGPAVSAVRSALASANARRVAGAALAVIVAAALSGIGSGWLSREATDKSYGSGVLAFMLRQPGFDAGKQPISFAPQVIASLAGPRLTHPLSLIPRNQPCAEVRERLRSGWVVVQPGGYQPGVTEPYDAPACLHGLRSAYDDGSTIVYSPIGSA
jgi:hypothetical protein